MRLVGRHAVLRDTLVVIDLERARVVGSLPSMPLAVRDDGAALLVARERYRSAQGPIRWARPVLADATFREPGNCRQGLSVPGMGGPVSARPRPRPCAR